jgi:hypothetical protein
LLHKTWKEKEERQTNVPYFRDNCLPILALFTRKMGAEWTPNGDDNKGKKRQKLQMTGKSMRFSRPLWCHSSQRRAYQTAQGSFGPVEY